VNYQVQVRDLPLEEDDEAFDAARV
jgi:hypothetical protein